MVNLTLYSPLIGKLININKVIDPVFAGKMVGDGVALEPTVGILYAPCSGVVKAIHNSKHAITLTTSLGIDVLMHVGIDSVNLNGECFNTLVEVGDMVELHQELLKFDIDFIRSNATSIQTPVVLIDIDSSKFGYMIELSNENVTQNDIIFEISNKSRSSDLSNSNISVKNFIKSDLITIRSQNGIHARPAAMLSNFAKSEKFEIFIHSADKSANLKSLVNIMALNIRNNDEIYFTAQTNKKDIFILLRDLINQFTSHDDSSISIADLPVNSKVDGAKFYGLSVSDGVVIANIATKTSVNLVLKEIAEDSVLELQKLYGAINQLSKTLSFNLDDHSVSAKYKDILTAHIAILNDIDLLLNSEKLIKENNYTAEFAVNTVIHQQIKLLENTGNRLLLERVSDFKDVATQLIMQIKGDSQIKLEFTEPTILLAHDFLPSELSGFGKNIIGLASIMGGATSHVSIMAKSKGIPLIIGLDPSILDKLPKGKAILNTRLNCLNLSPTSDELSESEAIVDKINLQKQEDQSSIEKPVITEDGFKVRVLANVISESEVSKSVELACDGVGLFRTEFIYFDKDKLPTMEMQTAIYSKLINANKGKEFVIRTLDAGGEKQLSYLKLPHELNPVLGVRGIRLSLEYKEVLIEQLLAIFNAASDHCKIMIPMVTDISEYRIVKKLIEELKLKHNIQKILELGVMVEVPSVALMADIYAQEVDFFSIGTNDLSQYVLAIDRDHPQLAGQIDHLHPSVIRCIEMVAKAGSKYNKPVSICGLMASDPIAIPVLVALGITNLSMNLSVIASNKALIRRLNKSKCDIMLSQIQNMATALEIRNYITTEFKF